MKKIIIVIIVIVLALTIFTAKKEAESGNYILQEHADSWIAPSSVLYINYTNYQPATGGLWHVKWGAYGIVDTNYTIPTDCFNQDPIQFQIHLANWIGGTGYLYCFDGSELVTIDTMASTESISSSGTGPPTLAFDGDYSTGEAWVGNGYWHTANYPYPEPAVIYEESIYWKIEVSYSQFIEEISNYILGGQLENLQETGNLWVNT